MELIKIYIGSIFITHNVYIGVLPSPFECIRYATNPFFQRMIPGLLHFLQTKNSLAYAHVYKLNPDAEFSHLGVYRRSTTYVTSATHASDGLIQALRDQLVTGARIDNFNLKRLSDLCEDSYQS